jgi:hypothetical protein
MYIFKIKQDNVKKILCNSLNSFILSSSKIYWNNKLIFEGKENVDIRLCINDFFSFGDNEIQYLGNFLSNEIKEFNFVFSSNCIWRQGFICIKNYGYNELDKKVKGDYYLFNFINNFEKLLLRDIEGGIISVFNEEKSGLYKNKTILKSLSLLTGEYEWELDLEEKLGRYDNIGTIFGVVDAILWLVSQRGILFGIDVNTGILVHHLNYDNVLSFQETGLVNSKYFHSLFDEKAKKLVGIYQKTYWEIDLLNPENSLKIFDLPSLNVDYFSNEWANPQGVVFDDQYIYFRDIEISMVGVLCRQTHKIVWHQRINDLEPRPSIIINNIQITETNLYVLDTGGTLHIFEKKNVYNEII